MGGERGLWGGGGEGGLGGVKEGWGVKRVYGG